MKIRVICSVVLTKPMSRISFNELIVLSNNWLSIGHFNFALSTITACVLLSTKDYKVLDDGYIIHYIPSNSVDWVSVSLIEPLLWWVKLAESWHVSPLHLPQQWPNLWNLPVLKPALAAWVVTFQNCTNLLLDNQCFGKAVFCIFDSTLVIMCMWYWWIWG